MRDGRYRQLQVWRRTGEFARERSGEPLLFITEDSTLTIDQKHDLMASACELADSLEQVGQLTLFNGDKQFSYYRGPFDPAACRRVGDALPLSAASLDRSARAGCEPVPEPPWSAAGPIAKTLGVARVLLYLDGENIAQFDYGLPAAGCSGGQGIAN